MERLRPVKHLVATVHSRLAICETIDTWHTDFHQTFEDLFERQLPAPIPAEHRAAEAAVATYALEGAITHDLDDTTTHQLCHITAERLEMAATAAGMTARH